MRKTMISAAVVLLTISSCGIYNKYESESTVPDGVFGSEVQATGQTSMARIPWRTFFTDQKLQQLIGTALERNTDLKAAELTVGVAEASLGAARLAFLPSLYLSPQGAVGRAGTNYESFNLGAGAEWEIDLFGGINNRRRQAAALLEQTRDLETLVRTKLIANVATAYQQLQILDRQLDIITKTETLWEQSLETQRALMENGKAYSTSVDQMEASLLDIRTQRIDIVNNIKDVENALCLLLAQTPQHIDRNAWGSFNLPQQVAVGLPAELLSNRADVRAAERAIENAYYVTAEARSNFYPKLTLSGTLGWTNGDMGSLNPAQWIMNAAASLAQPLFTQGKLRANLKISKLRQEEARQMFVQTVLNAGNEVNSCLADCQAARDKAGLYQKQVDVLQHAYEGTHELMVNGKATYLEVLTAQEALLRAQLGEAANVFNGNQALIDLYIALGGGAE